MLYLSPNAGYVEQLQLSTASDIIASGFAADYAPLATAPQAISNRIEFIGGGGPAEVNADDNQDVQPAPIPVPPPPPVTPPAVIEQAARDIAFAELAVQADAPPIPFAQPKPAIVIPQEDREQLQPIELHGDFTALAALLVGVPLGLQAPSG